MERATEEVIDDSICATSNNTIGQDANVDLGSLDDVNVDSLPMLRTAETMTEDELNSICNLARSSQLFNSDNADVDIELVVPAFDNAEPPEQTETDTARENLMSICQEVSKLSTAAVYGLGEDDRSLQEKIGDDFKVVASPYSIKLDCACQNLSRTDKAWEQYETKLVNAWVELRASLRQLHCILDPSTKPGNSQLQKPSIIRMKTLANMLTEYDPHQLFLRVNQLTEELCGELKVRVLAVVGKSLTPTQLGMFMKSVCEAYQWLMNVSEVVQPILEELEIQHLSRFRINWTTVNMHIFDATIYTDQEIQEYVKIAVNVVKQLEGDESLIGCLNSLHRTMGVANSTWLWAEKQMQEFAIERTVMTAKHQQLMLDCQQFQIQHPNFQKSKSISCKNDNIDRPPPDGSSGVGLPSLTNTTCECHYCNTATLHNNTCSPMLKSNGNNETVAVSSVGSLPLTLCSSSAVTSSSGGGVNGCTSSTECSRPTLYPHIYTSSTADTGGPKPVQGDGTSLAKVDEMSFVREEHKSIVNGIENLQLKSPKTKQLIESMAPRMRQAQVASNVHHHSTNPAPHAPSHSSTNPALNTTSVLWRAAIQHVLKADEEQKKASGTSPAKCGAHPHQHSTVPNGQDNKQISQKKSIIHPNHPDSIGGQQNVLHRRNSTGSSGARPVESNSVGNPCNSSCSANTTAVGNKCVSVEGLKNAGECHNKQLHYSDRSTSRESDEESELSDHDEWSTEDYSDGASTTASSSNHQDQHCDCCVCHMMHQNQGGGRQKYSDRRDRLLQILEKKKARSSSSHSVEKVETATTSTASIAASSAAATTTAATTTTVAVVTNANQEKGNLGNQNIEKILDYIQGDKGSKVTNIKKIAKKQRQREKKNQSMATNGTNDGTSPDSKSTKNNQELDERLARCSSQSSMSDDSSTAQPNPAHRRQGDASQRHSQLKEQETKKGKKVKSKSKDDPEKNGDSTNSSNKTSVIESSINSDSSKKNHSTNTSSIPANPKDMTSDQLVEAAVKGLVNTDNLNKTQKKKYKKIKKNQEEEKKLAEMKQREEDGLMDEMYRISQADRHTIIEDARNSKNGANKKNQSKQKENKGNQSINDVFTQIDETVRKPKNQIKLYDMPLGYDKHVQDSLKYNLKTKVLQPVTNQPNKLSERKTKGPAKYDSIPNDQPINKGKNNQFNNSQQNKQIQQGRNQQNTKTFSQNNSNERFSQNRVPPTTYSIVYDQYQQSTQNYDKIEDKDLIKNKVNKNKSSPEKSNYETAQNLDNDKYRVTNYKSTLRPYVADIFTDLADNNRKAFSFSKGKLSKKEQNENNIDDNIDSVFAPKDITDESNELDAAEKEVEEFKRFCFFNRNACEKPKVNFNVKDIVFLKKKPITGNL